ncbi:hypothetical protein [Achromobacter sp. Bel]|uniref:hypothetical protein n=1 Tax=Achromobacter sp. Bel TaxID=2727415 RepID=UPI00145E6E94|nr:hypothetical protein [Achromobacter sp. Bel]NMK44802.1 hypothetical protein [Achromobacter sp. Bel]
MDIDRLTTGLRADLKAEIDKAMQPFMVLMDEAVRLFMFLERHQFSLGLGPGVNAFAFQLSRLRSDALSIRELITLGQEAAAHALARSFFDCIELAMAIAEDPEFAEAYDTSESEEEFWRKHIAFGRIYPRVERFISRGCGSAKEAEYQVSRHRAVKGALSGHVHIARWSAFRTGVVPLLSQPGVLSIGAIGALSAHFPSLCLLIANEAHLFSACCINILTKPNPPQVFAQYRPSRKLNDVVSSTHVLQELLERHEKALEQYAGRHFDSYAQDEI